MPTLHRECDTSNRKTILLGNEKGVVGMAKCFSLKSTETKDKLSTMCNPKVMSRFLSTPDATSLHHCLQNHS